MTSLAFFLIFAGIFAVLMRFGCGSHVLGHHHGSQGEAGNNPDQTTKDPVCGMSVDTTTALSSIHAGQTYYFCSATCRDKFVASPEKYIGNAEKIAQKMENANAPHRH